jgi:hypothetical protein
LNAEGSEEPKRAAIVPIRRSVLAGSVQQRAGALVAIEKLAIAISTRIRGDGKVVSPIDVFELTRRDTLQ